MATIELMQNLKRIVFKKDKAVAYVRLNRPEKHNGLDKLLILELISVAKRIRKDKEVRAVILSGAGPSFCAGLDIKSLKQNPMMVPRLFLKWPWTSANGFQRVATVWRTLPVPTICVIHGNCFGGGLQIALGTDIRITTPDAHWSVMEAKWGIIPDMGITTTLTTLTRYDIAQELTLTGRLFSGEEALQYGLATRISQTPMAEAEQLAQQICQQSPDQTAAVKRLFYKTWKAGVRRALLWERWIQLRLLGRRNNRIALYNGTKKMETPKKKFKDRSLF